MPRQSGNVLFLILIAVALFAALSYAVTSSTRSGGGSASKEKAKANAAAIVQYAATLRSGIQRMKINNGCIDTGLEFNNSVFQRNDGTATNTANINAPFDKSCNLFDPAGGGMIPVVPGPDSLDLATVNNTGNSSKTGHGGFRVVEIQDIGSSADDLVFIISYLNKATCMAINDLLGVENLSNDAPAITNSGTLSSYVNGSIATSSQYNNLAINGKVGFCSYAVNNYRFVYTMIDL
ncbi:MAG: hypothetical protein DI586_04405 [Micavibrio aeruginosavorus]|uniref:Uncharacterized protein n=1 Tax=Micavibrio aeruginosavorus TaxID=349221 RepID=A0A2W5FMM5_9BACT|nr:MAG: hypothetical protein DI586_04405 [Micavibrio aeruginosavorus]